MSALEQHGSFGPHLGERVSAFVDGALAEDARDRVLVHLGGCRDCRAEVDAAGLLKARLAALPAPVPSAALTARLLAMGDPGGPIPPRPARVPGSARPATLPRPGSAPVADRPAAGPATGTRPPGRADRGRGPSGRRTVRLAALAGAALSTMVVAVVGLSGAVGPESQPTPTLSQLSQLTSDNGGVSDPIVDISRTLRRIPTLPVTSNTP